MSAAMDGELIERDVAERHDALMRQFAEGAARMCVALHRIRAEETYRARGHASFGAFLRSVGLSETNGRRYASLGPMLLALLETGDFELVKHPDMLRPIAGMLTSRQDAQTQVRVARRQAAIVRSAAALARREQAPLDEEMVARAAEMVGWRRPANYRAERSRRSATAPSTPSREEFARKLRQDVELAFAVVLDYRMSAHELLEYLGDPSLVAGFSELLQLLLDLRDGA